MKYEFTMSKPNKKTKRKKPYVPGVAALNFKVQQDWEVEEAKKLYDDAQFEIEVDKILFEDCIKGMEQIPENFIDLIIADPPFGIKFNGKGSQYNRDSDLVIDGYNEIAENYDTFTLEWISRLTRIMKETASAFIFSGWTNLTDVLVAIKQARLELINHIIWKYQFGVYTKKKFVTSHYHILFIVKNPKKYYFNKIEHYPLDIWEIPRTYRPGEQKNSTKLPEKVVQRCINFCSQPGDLVFDPFIGNGTTATCARASYRHFLGFEINRNMIPILNQNIKHVKIGSTYQPYRTFLPSEDKILKKYPHLDKKKKRKKKIKQETLKNL